MTMLQSDSVRRVHTARIVFVNHDLLEADLPQLAGAAASEHWLLEQAGIMSVAQIEPSVANTAIAATGSPRPAWRPPFYGRAVVVEAQAPATPGRASTLLLDIKGAGVAPGCRPTLAHHESGLCSLQEALREALFERMIAAIFARAAPDLWTLPIYGVIDLGFDLLNRRGEAMPAGLIVRRGHRRDTDFILPFRGSAEQRLRLEIELLLRSYGLTSSNAATRYRIERGPDGGIRIAYAGEPFTDLAPSLLPVVQGMLGTRDAMLCSKLNIQLVYEPAAPIRAQLVDFGHYEVRRRFEQPLVSGVCNAPHLWGAAIAPDHQHFVQPHPALLKPFERWVREDQAGVLGAVRAIDTDPTSRWAEQMVIGFRAGAISGGDIAEAIAAAAVMGG
jgi:hypothetical protein